MEQAVVPHEPESVQPESTTEKVDDSIPSEKVCHQKSTGCHDQYKRKTH